MSPTTCSLDAGETVPIPTLPGLPGAIVIVGELLYPPAVKVILLVPFVASSPSVLNPKFSPLVQKPALCHPI